MTKNANKEFDRLAGRIFKAAMTLNPTEASWLGVHGANDRKLPDRSAAACKRERAQIEAFIKALDRFKGSELSMERSVDLKLTRGGLSAQKAMIDKFPYWQLMPQHYVDEVIFGIYVPMIRNYAPVGRRAEDILGRMKAIPHFFRQAGRNIKRPPRVFTETAILSARGALDFLDTALAGFINDLRDPALKKKLKAEMVRTRAATEAYLKELQGPILSRSTGRYAVGKVLFKKLLRDRHGISYDPDDLLKIGWKVYRRTIREMKSVAAEIDKQKNWHQIIAGLRDDHPTARGLVPAYFKAMDQARRFVRKKRLVSFPEGESIQVVPTPAFARPILPYAAYLSPAPFEKEQKGTFWVTPPDASLPKEHQKVMLQGHMRPGIAVTALHEAYPGHHLQLSVANRLSHPLRHLFETSVFAEGWALYCEEMMYEQGFYKSKESRLLQLKDLLWRSCRVIIDVSLHTRNMSFDEAVDFLIKKAHLVRPNADAEVRRYCATPAQPMSYIMGKILILDLLEDYKRWKGPAFDLRTFHDDLLSHGTIPVGLVRREMGVPGR
ncbi:MAG: DUF885 domain-containing protein [Candidatus Eisenbacteria bacterium]|uniref:DUF885 domain-containing protein n=1 Tax=Eiseniibacteriota bacterium TaxID=2212470 RepID=A0A948RW57_UNCEI|nr:DUF885 domain-containing protein [Candidatus Eisenbacteria bacterium]MBU1947773.1 DUF885 domain-containing protein [Candidatus Eisenbacteria bacterium]MBU2691081.1 DUF885 domain-containing protein [Candidatus Eisenbacteria bacterium]